MDCIQDEHRGTCERIEGVIAGGAVGRLIGMLLGPLATLVCAVVGAEIGRRSAAHGKAPWRHLL